VTPPSDFSVLGSFHKNALLKIAHRTGCETAFWISLKKKYYV